MGRKRSVNQRAIIIRDNCCCQRCGVGVEIAPLEVHHIQPVHLGGSDDPSNLIALCGLCHAAAPDDPAVFPAFLESVPDHVIVAAVKSGAANPMEAAREFIRQLKALKDGLADDKGDLEEFLPFLESKGHELRGHERAAIIALAQEQT